jgi:hypothetical protein
MPERDYHLAEANRRIAETKQHIARQRETIAMLRTEHRPAAPALSMLKALEKSLRAFEDHRLFLLTLYSAKPGSPQRKRRLGTVVDLRAAE